MGRLGAGALLALLLCLPGPAAAHGRSHSYSTWEFDGRDVRVQVRLPRVELTRLGPLGLTETTGPSVSRYLARSLHLTADGRPCAVVGTPTPLSGREGWSVHTWRMHCDNDGPFEIESEILLAVAPSHLHFARVIGSDGHASERVLYEGEPRWTLPAAGSAGAAGSSAGASAGLLDYVSLGVQHIMTGWDHLAFVIALLLLATSLREVAGLVTGFTIGHSLTLALAVLGVVRTEATSVEAAVAFSVALVAIENGWLLSGRRRVVSFLTVGGLALAAATAACGWGAVAATTWAGLGIFCACHFGLLDRTRRPARLRVALAFAFGLIHGFGFAGVLAEMALPPERLAVALFGFNVGVEIGQLGVVLAVWPLLSMLASIRGGAPRRLTSELGSAAVAGLGLFWLLTRVAG